MARGHANGTDTRQDGGVEDAPGDADGRVELLLAIQQQGAQTLELVRAILNLLLPKEGNRERPTLEQLLTAILGQQREALLIAQATQADLARLGETLPDAVAEVVGDRAAHTGNRRPS